jgi:exonuclease III
MRIVTWNCQQAFRKKTAAFLSLRTDIASVQECSALDADCLKPLGYSGAWFGLNPHKGVSVFCRSDWPIRPLAEPSHRWIAPFHVDAPTPFTFIAVWACKVEESASASYIGQLYATLIHHPEWFERAPVVIAGDFNSNTIWDSARRVGNHSAVVEILKGLSLVSAYHTFRHEQHGSESRSTLYLYRKKKIRFHLDYIFAPDSWRIRTASVGTHFKWCKLSDHCPLLADLEHPPASPNSNGSK